MINLRNNPSRLCFLLENLKRKETLFPMQNLVRVELVALLPTQAGCAVFLGDGTKSIVFYIDPGVGASINASLCGQKPPRPLTHDLFLLTLDTFGAKISRAVIIRMEQEIYYARLIIEAENEIMERKIVELDARPSDCLALVVRCGAPIYVVADLWDKLDDMSRTLAEMRETKADDEDGQDELGIG
jgi:bifunctional DNase/RNase